MSGGTTTSATGKFKSDGWRCPAIARQFFAFGCQPDSSGPISDTPRDRLVAIRELGSADTVVDELTMGGSRVATAGIAGANAN